METYERLEGFTIRPYRSKRLEENYARKYSKDWNEPLYDPNVAAMLDAQDLPRDETPRSIYSVEKLYQALSSFAPGKAPKPFSRQEFADGVALARACFARKGHQEKLHVLPFTPETVKYLTTNKSASAGLTNYGATKAESMTRALERGLQTLRKEKKPEPCLGITRTQFNGKTRLVWAFPYSMTAIEGLVAKPLNENFKGGTTPMAYAIHTVHLGSRLRVSSYHKQWCYCLDMSQFDATLSKELIHASFDVLRTWYDLNEVEPISGCTVKEIFNVIEYYFVHTPIVMPNLNLYLGKDHGVPSGSYFTQMVDSVANVIICGSISSRFSLNVAKEDINVLGDDIIFWSNRCLSLERISSYAKQQFGVNVHGSEKSKLAHYDEALDFLGRTWLNGLPDMDADKLRARMVYPERYRRYDKDQIKKDRQVRMLILSYAAAAKSGWRIASRAFGLEDGYLGCGSSAVDPFVYLRSGKFDDDENYDFLSGLLRYQKVYVWSKQGHADCPVTPVQYWL